ncbi:MarR family transcriptional regulator [Lacticaseibacillus rhamnosus]|uniref:MarR family winged helix-turn-helix transcriptional regulator n=1 Tax=Lacticaseibacillus rhamnosus TaxID=47715 RepID=UPI0031F57DF7
MDSEPDELISRVNILARQIQHDLDLRLAPTRINASNYYFILKLGSVDDMRQDTLFKKIHLNASNVTRRLAQLITLGLVTKEKAADDKRAWVISLTAEGRALVPHVSQIVAEYEAELTAKLAAADKVKFEQTLDVLNKTKEDANR